MASRWLHRWLHRFHRSRLVRHHRRRSFGFGHCTCWWFWRPWRPVPHRSICPPWCIRIMRSLEVLAHLLLLHHLLIHLLLLQHQNHSPAKQGGDHEFLWPPCTQTFKTSIFPFFESTPPELKALLVLISSSMGLSLLELAVDKRLPMVEVNLFIAKTHNFHSRAEAPVRHKKFIQASKKIETSFVYLEEVPSF